MWFRVSLRNGDAAESFESKHRLVHGCDISNSIQAILSVVYAFCRNRRMYFSFPYLRFPPLRSVFFILAFSVLAFSNFATCTVLFHTCDFDPCGLYLPFPYLRFPVLAFSGVPFFKQNTGNFKTKTLDRLAQFQCYWSETVSLKKSIYSKI